MLADRLATNVDGRLSGHVDRRRASLHRACRGKRTESGRLGDSAWSPLLPQSLGRYPSVRQDGTVPRKTSEATARPGGSPSLGTPTIPRPASRRRQSRRPTCRSRATPTAPRPSSRARLRRRVRPTDPTTAASRQSTGLNRSAASSEAATAPARSVTRKVITASTAGRPASPDSSHLIWNQVLSLRRRRDGHGRARRYGVLRSVTACAAGNVLLYLLVTMAPFALIAPVIGPALTASSTGGAGQWARRRSAAASSPLIMAGHPTNLLVLYPCALGSLVLSKAYSVIWAAAAPRLVPPGMTLRRGERPAVVLRAGVRAYRGRPGCRGDQGVRVVHRRAHRDCSRIRHLRVLRLSVAQTGRLDAESRPAWALGHAAQSAVSSGIRQWPSAASRPRSSRHCRAKRLCGSSSGFLTVFPVFYIETTSHGYTAALALAGWSGAAGLGNFVGTATGTRMTLARPELIILIGAAHRPL